MTGMSMQGLNPPTPTTLQCASLQRQAPRPIGGSAFKPLEVMRCNGIGLWR